MPFKGDMRLGGPHDNEATLNGTSEGPDFLSEGTILSTLYDVPYTPVGPYSATWYNHITGSDVFLQWYPQRCDVNVVADGQGGEYEDMGNATNIEYYPADTLIYNDPFENVPIYLTVEYDGTTHQSGTHLVYAAHDGGGQVMSLAGPSTFFPAQELGSGQQFYNADEVQQTEWLESQGGNGNSYDYAYIPHYFYYDGAGGYIEETGTLTLYPENTVVGSYTDEGSSVYIDELDQNFPNGTSYNDIITDGLGGFSSTGNGGSYSGIYLLITQNGDDYYYHNGEGGYIASIGGPLATGNTSTGTNYIDIDDGAGQIFTYPNGTYSGDEYHDGVGGFYIPYPIYDYLPSGTEFGGEGASGWFSDGVGGYN